VKETFEGGQGREKTFKIPDSREKEEARPHAVRKRSGGKPLVEEKKLKRSCELGERGLGRNTLSWFGDEGSDLA